MKNQLLFPILIFFFTLTSLSCNSFGDQSDNDKSSEVVAKGNTEKGKEVGTNSLGLNLPKGFKIDVFAEVEDARSLAVSSSGVIYVGSRGEDKVYALRDTDGDWKADEKYIIDSGLKMPNGVAFKDGDLYVAAVNRILKYPNIEANLKNPPEPEVVYSDYPSIRHHGWKYIAFGPDGKLYVPVGAPCNICDRNEEIFASITRMNPDGTGLEIVAHGVRNSVGFDWNPETKELWFTDNGRDKMGDELPPCELNKVTKKGEHFGFPFCHGDDVSDTEFGSKRKCSEFVKPEYNFKAHTAPLGMAFYTGDMFPEDYKGDVIVAQHGSWNRSSKIGYRLMRIHIENNKAVKGEVFADGWLNDATQNQTGRPVDVLQMSDGSILVSDDYGNKIYRISYQK
ncbi:MAG: PQQ-dependent sugar dehydrogenase [Thermodesulfobacteriota bacterium]